MRIEIDIDDKYLNTEVTIKSPRLTQEIEKMISMMRMLDMQIAVKKNDETFCIYFDEATDGYTVSDNVMTEGSFGYNKPGPNLKVNQP